MFHIWNIFSYTYFLSVYLLWSWSYFEDLKKFFNNYILGVLIQSVKSLRFYFLCFTQGTLLSCVNCEFCLLVSHFIWNLICRNSLSWNIVHLKRICFYFCICLLSGDTIYLEQAFPNWVLYQIWNSNSQTPYCDWKILEEFFFCLSTHC